MRFLVLIISVLLWASVCSAQETPAVPEEGKLERTRQIMETEPARAVKEDWRTRPETDVGSSSVKMLVGLAFCAGLLLIASHFLKKYAIKSGALKGRRIKLLERTMLGPKASLVLAEVDGQRVLLAVGTQVSVVELNSPLASGSSFDGELEKAAGNSN